MNASEGVLHLENNKLTTIYIIKNPLGVISGSYSDMEEAKKDADKMYWALGEAYHVEPCLFQLSEEFKKKIDLLFLGEKKE